MQWELLPERYFSMWFYLDDTDTSFGVSCCILWPKMEEAVIRIGDVEHKLKRTKDQPKPKGKKDITGSWSDGEFLLELHCHQATKDRIKGTLKLTAGQDSKLFSVYAPTGD